MFVSFQSNNSYQTQSYSYFNGYVSSNQQAQSNAEINEAATAAEDLSFTTLAIGEEGGGEAAFQTDEVLKVLQHADNSSYGAADGQVSQHELSQFANTLDRQITMLKSFNQYFPWMGLGDVINNMERQLDTARFMNENYNNIADADGKAQSMTADDVRTTAANDGNANDLSLEDVQDVVTTQALGEEGGGSDNPQQTIKLMMLQQKWDSDRNGQLSRAEINNATSQLTERLEYLKGIHTLVFDPKLAAEIERVTQDLEGTQFMADHFDPIAQADGNRGGQIDQISIFDLLLSAIQDGNILEIDPAELPPAYVVDPPPMTTLALGEEGGGVF